MLTRLDLCDSTCLQTRIALIPIERYHWESLAQISINIHAGAETELIGIVIIIVPAAYSTLYILTTFGMNKTAIDADKTSGVPMPAPVP